MKKIENPGGLRYSLKKTLLIVRVSIVLLLIGVFQVHADDTYSRTPSPVFADESAQQARVTGTVIDEVTGEPLAGVTIQVKGTMTGSISDVNGAYSVNITESAATLVFSFVGYTTQEININGRAVIDVIMQEEITALDEVVVIGYGTQRKSNITGAISSVNSEQLANQSSQTVAHALQGKVAGVQLIQTSGAPGSQATIRVRGFSSVGSSDPLYIVDGLKVSSIGYLESNNIASIEILKDAASAAIYGAEAGNGVVLITTKSGKSGQGHIYYNGQYSVSSVSKKPDVLNAREWINYMVEQNLYTQEFIDSTWDGITDTDWLDVMFDKGYLHRHTLGFEGGSDRASYMLSLTYRDQDGMVVTDKDRYRSISAQINGSYQINNWLKVGSTTSFSNTETRGIRDTGSAGSTLSTFTSYDPLTPPVYTDPSDIPSVVQDAINQGFDVVRDEDGNVYGVSYYTITSKYNPLTQIALTNNPAENTDVLGTAYLDITPVKGLVYTSRFGYQIRNNNSYNYTPPYWANSQYFSKAPNLSVGQGNTLYYQWENFANYNVTVGKSDFTAMGGMSYIRSIRKNQSASTDGLQSVAPNYLYLDYSLTGANDIISGTTTESAQIAYFGRLGWSYGGRYDVQVNFRADAYDWSKLDPSNSWGYFPSVSAGWTLSNEGFMANLRPVLSHAKLRASYGINGSISNLGGYQYASTMLSNMYYSMDGDALVTGLLPSTFLANPELEWESSKQLDLGVDLRFFNNRLSFTTDFYSKNTSGMLINTTPSLISGCSSMYKNVGIIHNHGFEFEAEWKDNIGKFGYDIRANLATISNEVREYEGKGKRLQGAGPSFGTVTYFEEGYPLWYLRGYQVIGIDPENGDPIYADNNDDGEINDADKEYIGDGIPDFTYGLTLSFNYSNFDLTLIGNGSYGSDIFFALSNMYSAAENRYKFMYDDRWTPENTNATRPKPTMDSKYYLSDAMLFSGDYFRIKQLQLGYSLPGSVLGRIGMSSARVYVSLEDYFTFTSYVGLDPETRFSTSSGLGLDQGATPIPKQVMFGLNLSF
jgi:TonB-linked SusC/RagA family outer membrane protein